MKTVILAGGLGTRLEEATMVIPKPMVEIGGRPILWHIMKIYAHYQCKEFVIALGYKGDLIKQFFLNYYSLSRDFTIALNKGSPTMHGKALEDWAIHLHDTGAETQTGGRLKRLAPLLKKGTFLLTYGDGVANIDIRKLLAFHKKHGKLATVTAVRPPARFGSLQFRGNQVTRFSEKPQAGEGWINGGFFVLESRVLDYIDSDRSVFEKEPLERLAREGQLMAYHHADFWQCMDTLRDVRTLETLWQSARAPWKVWA